MSNFKKNYQTSEFITTAFWLVVLFCAQYFQVNLNYWACAVAVVVSSYLVSRGIFKTNRIHLQYNGFKTSEFWTYLAGSGIIASAVLLHGLDVSVGIIAIAAIQAAYNHSRAQTKLCTKTRGIEI